MAGQGLGFPQVVDKKVPERALERVKFFLWKARAHGLRPSDLHVTGHLFTAIRAGAQITGIMPVGKAVLLGYKSWLAQSGGYPIIAVTAELYSETAKAPGGQARAQSLLLAITAHEAGHELMRPPEKPRKFVTKSASLILAEPETLESEEEAWLFAGFLRAFVLADVAGQRQPDTAPNYV